MYIWIVTAVLVLLFIAVCLATGEAALAFIAVIVVLVIALFGWFLAWLLGFV